MDDLIKQLVKVADITIKRYETGQQAKVKSEDNKTYTVYEKKQDGSTSVAWKALEKVKIGDAIEVGFVEKPGEYEGKAYTSRIVRIINQDIGNGMANAIAQETRNSGQNTASQGKSDDQYWEMKAYKQCLWNFWLQKTNIIGVSDNWKDEIWTVFKEIEADAKKRFFDFGTSEPLPEELPTIQQNEDMDVSDIPF